MLKREPIHIMMGSLLDRQLSDQLTFRSYDYYDHDNDFKDYAGDVILNGIREQLFYRLYPLARVVCRGMENG
jgi:hypothetical protein